MTISHRYTQQAIEKSIKGGFRYNHGTPLYNEDMNHWCVTDGDGGYIIPSVVEFFMLPNLWQCLEKELFWNNMEMKKERIHWLDMWISLVKYLGHGGDYEGFFKELLK